MPKYDFNEMKIPGRVLPDDINAPVIALFRKHYPECPELEERIRELERRKATGPFIIAEPGTPRTINLKVQYGMIPGIDLFETHETKNGQLVLAIGTHMRNGNIIMPKRLKGSNDGHHKGNGTDSSP
jgi:hypothetical protein